MIMCWIAWLLLGLQSCAERYLQKRSESATSSCTRDRATVPCQPQFLCFVHNSLQLYSCFYYVAGWCLQLSVCMNYQSVSLPCLWTVQGLLVFTTWCTYMLNAVLPFYVVCMFVCLFTCLYVTLMICGCISWVSSKVITPVITLGLLLLRTPTSAIYSKGNIPKFCVE